MRYIMKINETLWERGYHFTFGQSLIPDHLICERPQPETVQMIPDGANVPWSCLPTKLASLSLWWPRAGVRTCAQRSSRSVWSSPGALPVLAASRCGMSWVATLFPKRILNAAPPVMNLPFCRVSPPISDDPAIAAHCNSGDVRVGARPALDTRPPISPKTAHELTAVC